MLTIASYVALGLCCVYVVYLIITYGINEESAFYKMPALSILIRGRKNARLPALIVCIPLSILDIIALTIIVISFTLASIVICMLNKNKSYREIFNGFWLMKMR